LQLGLPSELVRLSDFNRDFGRSYDLLYTTSAGLRDVLRRSVLTIDTQGRLVYRWDVPDPPRIPSVEEILDAIRKIPALTAGH
jgi:peroxiredoxin